jgi:ABC-type antimicrobial peptide transport system permease subunit
VQPLADIVSAEVASRRVQVGVLGAFAAIAFLVAGIGLHGLLAYNVSQRSREIGVRLALQALLADVSPTDGLAFGAAIALAMLMTLAGSLLPALRAVRVDPIEVMRAE